MPRSTSSCSATGAAQKVPQIETTGLESRGVLQRPLAPIHEDALHWPFAPEVKQLDSVWDMAARANGQLAVPDGPLRIVVLGTSTSNGCGALDAPWANRSGPTTCKLSHSWVRRLHDHLVVRGAEARVQLWAKNAVGPAFFLSCLGERVPPDSSVVLLEVATNLWGASPELLSQLVEAVRREAPSALVAFVVWPAAHLAAAEYVAMKRLRPVERAGHCAEPGPCPTAAALPDASKVDSTEMRALAEAAAATRVDLLRAGAVMAWLRMRSPSRYTPAAFYAAGGKDQAHPSAMGHALIAELCARWLARRLCARGGMAMAANRGTGSYGRAASPRPVAPPRQRWERCLTSATQLPVNASDGWQLLDGGRAKGVAKWGLVSERKGDALVLGPLPSPEAPIGAAQCVQLSVCVGYLLSAYGSPPNGAFDVSCDGCTCAPVMDKMGFGLNPFPHIDTATERSTSRSHRRANVSITEATCFHALRTAGQPCMLRIGNVGVPGAGGATSLSRVELDSLTVEGRGPPVLADLAHMWSKPSFFPGTARGRGSSLATTFARQGLRCWAAADLARECREANATSTGYARAHAQKLCSLGKVDHHGS